MNNQFEKRTGAAGYQLSNPDALSLASLYGSLNVFSRTDMKSIRRKSSLLSAYLRLLLEKKLQKRVSFLTPSDPAASGAQLSVSFDLGNPDLFMAKVRDKGLMIDLRTGAEHYPTIFRLAPNGLYNTFMDVNEAAQIMIETFLEILQ